MQKQNNLMAQAITEALMVTPQKVQQCQGNPDAPTAEEQNTFLKDYVSNAEDLPKLSDDSRNNLYTKVKGLVETAAKAPKEQTAEEKATATRLEAEAKTAEETAYAGVKAGKILSQEAVGRIAALARSEGVSFAKAQKLLEAADKEAGSVIEAKATAWNNTVHEWEGKIKVDPEIGGANFESATGLAKKVVARFGSEELIKVLRETGLGSSPEVVRTFYRIGKMFKEDDLILPGSQQNKEPVKNPATVLYGEDGVSGQSKTA